jgi:hypothetical protein
MNPLTQLSKIKKNQFSNALNYKFLVIYSKNILAGSISGTSGYSKKCRIRIKMYRETIPQNIY